MAANLQVYSIMKRADEIRGSIGLDYSDEVKKKLDWKMDDALLRQKLNDSVATLLLYPLTIPSAKN